MRAPSFQLEKLGETLDDSPACTTQPSTQPSAPMSPNGETLDSPRHRTTAGAGAGITHHSAHVFEVQMAATVTASSPSIMIDVPHDATATELATTVVDKCSLPASSFTSAASSSSFVSSSAWEEDGPSIIGWRMEVDGTALEGTLDVEVGATSSAFDRRAGCAQRGNEVLLSSVFADLVAAYNNGDGGASEYRMVSGAEATALDASILACEFDADGDPVHVDSPCACFTFTWYVYDPRVAAGFITDDPSEYASSAVQDRKSVV